MRQSRHVFEQLRRSTGMYVFPETYEVVSAYVAGYDHACEGGVLVGFREWLVLRLRQGSNLAWTALVLDVAFPDTSVSSTEGMSQQQHRHAIDTLFRLIDEYDEEVRKDREGLNKLFQAHAEWTRAQRD